jgi:hypothetical protein
MSETRERIDDDDRDDAASDVELSLLRTENERLRRELERTTRTTYRRTAIALLAVGLASALAGIALPASREVLVVVGAIGVFGGVLTYYLTPERVLAASVTESVYNAHANAITSIQTELGLREEYVYVPDNDRPGGAALYIPLHSEYEIPQDTTRTFQTGDSEHEHGVTLQPTGGTLARALENSLSSELEPNRLATVIPEAIVEQFELADNATAERTNKTLTIEVDGPALDRLDRPDHPITSLAAVSAARALDDPITVENIDTTNEQITISW